MQPVFTKDLNSLPASNLGVNVAQTESNQGGFADLLQSTLDRPEQSQGSLVPEKRQALTPERAHQEDTHLSKKDAQPAGDTQVAKKDAQPTADTQVAKKDAQSTGDTHLSKKDAQPTGDTQVAQKDAQPTGGTQLAQQNLQLAENTQALQQDAHLAVDTQVSQSVQQDAHIQAIDPMDQAQAAKSAQQTDFIDQLAENKLDEKAVLKQTAALGMESQDKTNSNVVSTLATELELPLKQSTSIVIAPEQVAPDAVVTQPILPMGLLNQTPVSIEDEASKPLKAEQTEDVEPMQLQADNERADQIEQIMLEKLQALLGKDKGLEFANALENKQMLQPLKDQLSKSDNLKSFNQSDIQQTLQSLVGLQKTQDNGSLTGSAYKLEVQGRVAQQVNDKIIWMTQQDMKQARLVLEPGNLGTIDIQITMHKNEATVHFLSNNQAVKEAIQSNMHQLGEQLAQDGITLMQSDVQTQQQGRQAFGYEANTAAPFLGAGQEDIVAHTRISSIQDGVLHLYV